MSNNIFLEVKECNDDENSEISEEDLAELKRLNELNEKLWSGNHLTHTFENIKRIEDAKNKIKKINAIQTNFGLMFKRPNNSKKINTTSNVVNTKKVVNTKRVVNKSRYRGFMSF